MPGHPNEQPPVMAKVGRPPILRIRHQGMQVRDYGIQVEAVEFLGVIECLTHRIGEGRVLVENLNVQLVRPPVTVRAPARERALAFTSRVAAHTSLTFGCRARVAARLLRSFQLILICGSTTMRNSLPLLRRTRWTQRLPSISMARVVGEVIERRDTLRLRSSKASPSGSAPFAT